MKKTYRIVVFEGIDGSGKSTLLREASKLISNDYKVFKARLAPIMVEVFKDLVDKPLNETGKYQDVIPSEFRHASYIIESIVQFRLLQETYQQFDFVFFNRWLHTNWVYLAEIYNYRDWFQEVARYIPKPDIIFYARVRPAAAVERLIRRNDWMFQKLGEDRLLSHLTLLEERYDSLMQGPEVRILDAEENIPSLTQQVLNELRKEHWLH